MKFVLVNGRLLYRQSFCAKCKQAIGAGYLREIGTQLLYCDDSCYAEHCKSAVQLLEGHARSFVNALDRMTAFPSVRRGRDQEESTDMNLLSVNDPALKTPHDR